MKFWASTAFSPPEHYVPLARAAEAAGVHGLLMSDHIFFPKHRASRYPYSATGEPIWAPETPWPDVWVTVGAMLSATTTLHFGTSVYIAPARDLFTVAKQVGTAAVLSGDRVHLGLGAGWMREEFDQTGQSFTNRGRRTDEMIEALRVLWRGGWVEFHGSYYDFGPLQIEPAPRRTVPIWCGGHSDAALRRAARHCDGWIGNAYTEEDADHYLGELDRHLAEAGRTGEPFEIIIGLYAAPTPEVIGRWEARGVTGILCMPWFLAERTDDGDVSNVQGTTSLDRKIEATMHFGETVIGPLARASSRDQRRGGSAGVNR
ncbi:MAG TPA: TIGR03619 family F420-dependent LLM class oxidoreductase [Acidimicrobiales bacterium]|jgi:probable F420-dependent oxidoreductase|nr:TIGR03619 family F420-dependent LLM class oxidoreductase [Acidimicrobiales bacterium]